MDKIPADIHVVDKSFFDKFFLTPPSNQDERKPWPNTQVIGVEAHDDSDYDDSVFRLYEAAEEVFQEQPTRPFLHGFLLCENQIELWLFSRSGIYRSGLFFNRITNLSDIFARYSKMSDAQLGMNPIVHSDEDGSQYIYVHGSATNKGPYKNRRPQEHKLTLEKRPFALPPNLSNNFSTCYSATDCHDNVFLVMFSTDWDWGSGKELQNTFEEHNILCSPEAIDDRCFDAGPVTLSCTVWSF